MKVIKDSSSIFASRPTGNIKLSKRTDNKFGYINSYNASGQSTPVILPVTPSPEPEPETPAPAPAPAPEAPPAAEPEKPKDEVSSEKDADNSTYKVVAYGAGIAIGAFAGYFVADKYNKNTLGGLLIGSGVVAGGVYLFFKEK